MTSHGVFEFPCYRVKTAKKASNFTELAGNKTPAAERVEGSFANWKLHSMKPVSNKWLLLTVSFEPNFTKKVGANFMAKRI